MADVFSAATEPRILAEMMTEIPALDILEIKYVTCKKSWGHWQFSKAMYVLVVGLFPKLQQISFFYLTFVESLIFVGALVKWVEYN